MTNFQHNIRIALRPADMTERLKEQNRYIENDFMDDTGSKHMLMYEQDGLKVEDFCNFITLEAGQTFVRTAAGTEFSESSISRQPYSGITKCLVPLKNFKSLPGQRLPATWHPVVRLPDSQGRLYMSDQMLGNTRYLTEYEQSQRVPPPLVAYHNDRTKLMQPVWAIGHYAPPSPPTVEHAPAQQPHPGFYDANLWSEPPTLQECIAGILGRIFS
ncbi:hypothetical protein N7520_002156 [Penicillium odoratum]|uniref:uncharacterized protein n=1 Tax=Penicillium odoratum TaxID=1167516 RepID=UPI0025476F41|nr:uncharacterized protein N7520_002156 [Penicillium odoratum]KAJ5771627.1 hypothetical protein N7520_002156 [Penicillium odoratum]